MAGKLVIKGIYGAIQSLTFYIKEGQTVILGRSRSCDICLQSNSTTQSGIDDDHTNKHLQTVSRRHLKIAFHTETSLELEDLSANGTLLDGEKITGKVVIDDITTESHTLLLGTREKILLQWELY